MRVWLGLIFSLLFVTGCPGPQTGVRPAGTGDKPPDGGAPPGRSFRVEVDETNLILASEAEAKDYLRKKLVGTMAAKLSELGFDGGQATRLSTDGKLEAFSARGHEERIHGQGKDAGLIKTAVLWDVKGVLEVGLSDDDLRQLIDHLDGLPLSSMQEVDVLERYLARLAPLVPDDEAFIHLRRKVGDRWAALLTPWLKIQLDIPVEPLGEYRAALGRVAMVLGDFRRAHPEHPGFAPLEKAFTLAALKGLRSMPVKAENFQPINDYLGAVERMGAASMPGLMPYLKRDLELAWRDHLVALDDAEAPFPETRKGFLYFLELYPKSQFYPDLELRFLTRWYEHLLATKPEKLEALVQMQREVELLSTRFPHFGRLADVRAALGLQCVRVLGQVEAADLKQMAHIKKVRQGCEASMPAGNETVQMRARLDRMEQQLTERRDDRLEKKALDDLTFFIAWDEAIRGLKWGQPKDSWVGQGAFAAKWATGTDAGADCRCSLDPDEPCRAFEQEGPAGGFELVARFHQGRLAGVDLCSVYVGDKLTPVYQFFARRYDLHHEGSQAAAFLAGAGGPAGAGGLGFAHRDDLKITLERSADTCTVRYQSVAMMSEQQRARQAAAKKEAAERAKARAARLRKGFSPGSCVRWACEPVCGFTGRTKTHSKGRYMVTITRSREDRRQVGTDVWVPEKQLYDCQ